VCDNNKIYPAAKDLLPGAKELLLSFTDSLPKTIFTMKQDTSLMPDFVIPKEYKYLYVEVAADVNLASPYTENQPAFRLGLVDKKKFAKNYLYWSNRDIVLMTKNDYMPEHWNHVSTNDMFTLDDYRNYNDMIFELALFNQTVSINLKIKQLKVSIYGIR
jgi:hypothetical protein